MRSKYVLWIRAALASLALSFNGPSPPPAGAVPRSAAELDGLTPSTSEEAIAARVDALVAAGRSDAGVAIVSALSEGSPFYQGRGPQEVTRLRGYLLWALAEVGPPPESLPFILAELVHGNDPYLVAAAARAAGALGSDKAVPHLIRFLGPTFHDDEVSFERYKPDWPLARPTTARLEVVKALERMGPLSAPAREALRSIAVGGEDGLFYDNRELREAAERALQVIGETACPDHPAEPDSSDVAHAEPWLAPDEREQSQLAGIHLFDHEGRELRFRDLWGRPFVVTFFYTRCDNPNKCSLTMAQLGRLQRAVREAGLDYDVGLLALTLDPAFDTPVRLRRFAENRGVALGERVRAARITNGEDFERLLQELAVSVALGRGQVSAHDVELLLFDKRGRCARAYRRVLWDNAAVVRDLKKLVEE